MGGGHDQPSGAEGHMPFDGHRSCGAAVAGEGARSGCARQAPRPAVLATFQPLQKQILIIVAGGNPAGVALDLDEARSIHAAIGQALKLADSVEWPMEVVS